MIKNTIKTTAVLGALMIIMGAKAPITKIDAASINGKVTASTLNVRSGASTSYSIVGKVQKGTTVEILSEKNGWYEIEFAGNKTGWSSGDYITKMNSSSSNTTTTKTGIVTASTLNVRSGASTSYSIVGKISKGTTVTITSTSNGWHQIKYSGNKSGWVSGDYISQPSNSSSNASLNVVKTLNVKAYAYTGGGITATGTKARYGTLAVDPKVIPYGTKVYIKELDKVFTAEDCGGGIKGNKIDIYMPTTAQCNSWGVRNITIQILK